MKVPYPTAGVIIALPHFKHMAEDFGLGKLQLGQKLAMALK
jgi:hypothetical protein